MLMKMILCDVLDCYPALKMMRHVTSDVKRCLILSLNVGTICSLLQMPLRAVPLLLHSLQVIFMFTDCSKMTP